MASVGEPLRSSPFSNDGRGFHPAPGRTLPILTSSVATSKGPGDPMDVSKPQPSMGPPLLSPTGDRLSEQQHHHQQSGDGLATTNGMQNPPVGAAAAAQQPKVVQTAFIHKLYNMLEDQSIQHLISWSSTNESFVMSPSSDFSKVLAQYFKHTNISSFVRQLNMYGFHKVSDVFHTGSPDSPLWEFKHGAGNFKRGDLAGLREIKRRASRHALIHRDSFSSAPKMPTPLPAGPPTDTVQDPVEARLGSLEWNMQDLYVRLSRTEEAHAAAMSKCNLLYEGLVRCHQWNSELSTQVLSFVPDSDNPVHRDVYAMRQDIARQLEGLRAMDDPQEGGFFPTKHAYFSGANTLEPLLPSSPRQRPYDSDSRRPSLQAIGRPNSWRSPLPAHLQVSPRRFGSIGTGSGAYSPSSATRPSFAPPPPPPPPPAQNQAQHPLSNIQPPPSTLPRRHTSADIRLQGWQGGQPPPNSYNPGGSPYASGQNSTAWPSSPRTTAHSGDHQQIRDALAQYELPRASNLPSRQPSPPAPHDGGVPTFTNSFGGGNIGSSNSSSYANSSNDAGWQLPGARYPFKGIETPGPPTRRSSMASNVHSLLNPADTAEREGEDEGPDERKRRRFMM